MKPAGRERLLSQLGWVPVPRGAACARPGEDCGFLPRSLAGWPSSRDSSPFVYLDFFEKSRRQAWTGTLPGCAHLPSHLPRPRETGAKTFPTEHPPLWSLLWGKKKKKKKTTTAHISLLLRHCKHWDVLAGREAILCMCELAFDRQGELQSNSKL